MRLMQQQQIAADRKHESSLRLPELQGPTSSSGRILVHSESPGSNRKKKTKRNKKKKKRTELDAAKLERRKAKKLKR